jgi:hypothetical protein
MLGLEALIHSVGLCELVCAVRDASIQGDQAQVSRLLPLMGRAADDMLPILKGVIAAQRQAAEALHLTQRPDIRVIASIGCPQPHPNPANDERHPNTTNQPEPAA